MNCLDCTLAGTTTPAVATCHSCGAAVCADHAVIQPHYPSASSRSTGSSPSTRPLASSPAKSAPPRRTPPNTPNRHTTVTSTVVTPPPLRPRSPRLVTAVAPRDKAHAGPQPDLATATPRPH